MKSIKMQLPSQYPLPIPEPDPLPSTWRNVVSPALDSSRTGRVNNETRQTHRLRMDRPPWTDTDIECPQMSGEVKFLGSSKLDPYALSFGCAMKIANFHNNERGLSSCLCRGSMKRPRTAHPGPLHFLPSFSPQRESRALTMRRHGHGNKYSAGGRRHRTQRVSLSTTFITHDKGSGFPWRRE